MTALDRRLEIALISSALAIAWGLVYRQRLREGHVWIWRRISRGDNPSLFWSAMIILALPEVVFVGLAVADFFNWWVSSRA